MSDIDERYEIILLVNLGLGIGLGVIILAAFISFLHMKTRKEIIKELRVGNTESIHPAEEGRIVNSPMLPRFHVNKDPEGQYMEMRGRTRS